jgi:hypothetical protein
MTMFVNGGLQPDAFGPDLARAPSPCKSAPSPASLARSITRTRVWRERPSRWLAIETATRALARSGSSGLSGKLSSFGATACCRGPPCVERLESLQRVTCEQARDALTARLPPSPTLFWCDRHYRTSSHPFLHLLSAADGSLDRNLDFVHRRGEGSISFNCSRQPAHSTSRGLRRLDRQPPPPRH